MNAAVVTRINSAARAIASDDVQVDDIQQTAYLHVLEREQATPDYQQQHTVSYVTTGAIWQAKHRTTRAQRIYRKHVGELDNRRSYDNDDSGDESMDWEEITPGRAPTPEEAAIIHEILEGIKQLSPKNQQVVRLIYAGYSQTEIAHKLGVSPAAVAWQLGSIRNKLNALFN